MANQNLKRRLKARDSDIEAFILRLDRFLGQNLESIVGGLEQGDVTAQEAANVLGSLETELINAGLEEQVQDLHARYADEINEVRRLFNAQGLEDEAIFADIDIDTIEQLINFDVDQVTQLARQAVGDVRSQLMRSVIAGEKPDVAAIIGDVTGSLQSQLRTELNTLLAGFARSVTVGKAKELGFELFEYLGPDDDVTRPFCERVLDKDPPIYTREEISEMDNEQGLDVFAYGGGYNCRHDWSPISEEKAREQGWEP